MDMASGLHVRELLSSPKAHDKDLKPWRAHDTLLTLQAGQSVARNLSWQKPIMEFGAPTPQRLVV